MYLIFFFCLRRVVLKWICKVFVVFFISVNFFCVWYILVLVCILVVVCFSNRNFEWVFYVCMWFWIMIIVWICFMCFWLCLFLYNDCSMIMYFFRWRKCFFFFFLIINVLKIFWISIVEFWRSKNCLCRIIFLINVWIWI